MSPKVALVSNEAIFKQVDSLLVASVLHTALDLRAHNSVSPLISFASQLPEKEQQTKACIAKEMLATALENYIFPDRGSGRPVCI